MGVPNLTANQSFFIRHKPAFMRGMGSLGGGKTLAFCVIVGGRMMPGITVPSLVNCIQGVGHQRVLKIIKWGGGGAD
jgi:hypothetical protein